MAIADLIRSNNAVNLPANQAPIDGDKTWLNYCPARHPFGVSDQSNLHKLSMWKLDANKHTIATKETQA